MKRWLDVINLVHVAEANKWDMKTFKALLDWEFTDEPVKALRAPGKKRVMSEAAREKIRAAQKARWAKVRKAAKS